MVMQAQLEEWQKGPMAATVFASSALHPVEAIDKDANNREGFRSGKWIGVFHTLGNRNLNFEFLAQFACQAEEKITEHQHLGGALIVLHQLHGLVKWHSK